MKKFIAILAMACILAAAGCGNTQNTSDTASTTAPEESDGSESVKEVTQVAYAAPEREDTTEDSLKYLEQNAPIFYNYLKIRRSDPLIFETEITKDGQVWETGTYIKDSEHFAQYSKSPDGSEIRVVYTKDTGYQIESAKKTLYVFEFGEKNVHDTYINSKMGIIYFDDVLASTYANDTAEYEGKEYDRVTITTADGVTNEYYFDKATGALQYTVGDGYVTRVKRLESAVPDESIFDIPTDYTEKTANDYYREQLEASLAENAAQ